MTWPPVDSADAREQREAEAETDATYSPRSAAAFPQVNPGVQPPHDSRCRRGWLGEDPDGRPRPCLTCRPWLAHVDCRTCGTPWQACGAQLHARHIRCCPDCNHQPTKESR